MITIIFSPTDAFAQKFQQMPEEKKNIFLSVIQNLVSESFTPHATYRATLFVSDLIEIRANGVSPFNKLDIDRYIQEISNKLVALKLDQFFVIAKASSGICPLDKILSPSVIREVNCHEALETIFEIEEKAIPIDFICTITHKIMGNPAYLTSNPKVFYEYSALIEWISEKGTDPTTRAKILAPGILVNDSLKQTISNFIADYAFGKDIKKYHAPTRDFGTNTDSEELKATPTEDRTKLRRLSLFGNIQAPIPPAESKSKFLSSTPLLQALEVCKLTEDFTKLLGKSLRRAANAELNKEIEVLFSTVNPGEIIDLQDDNPKTRNTALHFAINKLHISTVELLILNNAKTNIPNAQGVTAETLLKASSDARLTKIATDMDKPKIDHLQSLTR